MKLPEKSLRMSHSSEPIIAPSHAQSHPSMIKGENKHTCSKQGKDSSSTEHSSSQNSIGSDFKSS